MSQPLVKRTVRYSAIILLMIFICKTGRPLPGRTVQYNGFNVGGGGDVGVGVAAAGFIFPCLYLAIFSNIV